MKIKAMTGRRGLRVLGAVAIVAGFGWVAKPAQALTAYTPSMVLNVASLADTAPNNPCTTTIVNGGYVNSGACGLRGAVEAANHYLANFTGACLGAPAPVGQPVVRIKLGNGTYPLSYGDLDLSGRCDNTRSAGNVNSLIQIVGGGPAAVRVDGSGNAALSGNCAPATSCSASVFTQIVPLQMSGLTITGGQGEDFGGCNPCGGGINGDDSDGMSLSNVVITHNWVRGSSAEGGGIYENDWNSFSLTNVQVTQNAAGAQGGGIFNDGGLISMNNVSVSGNIACNSFSNALLVPWAAGNLCIDTNAPQGGGIYNEGGITMDGGSISGNSAGSLATGYGAGGGVYNSWTMQLTGVSITGNTAGNAGGGVQNHDNLVMTGGKVQNNRSGAIAGGWGDGACNHRSANGSNVCSGSGDDSGFFGTTISGNTSGGTFDCQTIPATSCTYDVGSSHAGYTAGACPVSLAIGEHCFSSDGVGGGVYLNDSVKLTGGGITGNTAVSIGAVDAVRTNVLICQGEGGGVWNQDDLLYMKSAQLSNNLASCGGGEYIHNYSASNLYSTHVVGNSATGYGGAFYADSIAPPGVILLNNSIVLGNKAGIETGGVYAVQGFGAFLLEGTSSIVGNTGGGCPNTNYPCG